MSWPGVIEHYRERLPLPPGARAVTLLEGNTPLVEAPRLAAALGFEGRLFLKYEGLNPTCSFKDRGMTMAITMAVADGAKAVICASTGNTSKPPVRHPSYRATRSTSRRPSPPPSASGIR